MQIELLKQWNSYLNKFPSSKKDIYFTEEYVKLYEDDCSEAVCLVVTEEKNILLMPFIKRRISDLYFDFETAYGYGGPIANTDDILWIMNSLKESVEYLKNEGFVAGFTRFHPVLKNADLCRDIFTVIDDRFTVSINTEENADSIWTNQIISKNRNMIRKAEKNGLTFEADYEFKELDAFISLYNTTMKRLEADEFYFFDDKYYKKYVESFKGKSFLGLIKKDGLIVGAAMFMYDGIYGHYHLAGSNREYTTFGVNNLLLWNAAQEMHNNGIKNFHLGGGTSSSEDDSLFKFKSSFSKNLNQFSIGKLVINESIYKEICKDWENKNPEKVEKYGKLLLKYRY